MPFRRIAAGITSIRRRDDSLRFDKKAKQVSENMMRNSGIGVFIGGVWRASDNLVEIKKFSGTILIILSLFLNPVPSA
jgi:hypothetical protein